MTVTNGLLGAGFFPQVISIILMIMILIYLIGLFRKGNVKPREFECYRQGKD